MIMYNNAINTLKQSSILLEIIMIGKNIKEIREKKGITQDKLARLADIPYTTLNKIEIGLVKRPRVDTIGKIARALNVKIDSLVNG